MHLKKGISFFGVFSIASGAMISSGIFILPGMAFSLAGPAVFISYILAGVMGLLGIFSLIELSTAMPKAGGDYFFVNKTFGPMLGTISGFLGWFALSLKSAFAVFGIAKIIYLYTGFPILTSGFFLVLFFMTINIIGVKEAAAFQITMVVGLLSLMAAYILFGLPQVNFSNFSGITDSGFNQILITSGFVFISFGGLLKVANVSEEVDNPKRNIPLGIISSIVVVTALYGLITFVITGTLDPEAFAASLTPVADSAQNILGGPGYFAIIIASTLAFFTTANAGIMSASRYPMALSRDNLLPDFVAIVHGRFNTPVIAITITGIIIFLSLLLPLEILVKVASTVILTSYVLTNLAVVILRESGLKNYKPSFKAPLYPWLQIFSIILFSFFIVDLGKAAMEISLAFLFLSFCIYFFYGRRKNQKEFALLHMLKRIVDKRIMGNTMEDELREILVSRENIEQDQFDHLVHNAKVVDVEKKIDFDTLLEISAPDIAKQTGLDTEEVISRFKERQEVSNTAISDFLAIPHIITDDDETMFMTIVRAKQGVVFTETENEVKAVFLLGGPQDKRVLHLKTIASIATLVGEPGFQKKWLEAENTVVLKNIMLLSTRRRFH
ncbi:MAG: amino acid permease [Spirochaetia bacterium]